MILFPLWPGLFLEGRLWVCRLGPAEKDEAVQSPAPRASERRAGSRDGPLVIKSFQLSCRSSELGAGSSL